MVNWKDLSTVFESPQIQWLKEHSINYLQNKKVLGKYEVKPHQLGKWKTISVSPLPCQEGSRQMGFVRHYHKLRAKGSLAPCLLCTVNTLAWKTHLAKSIIWKPMKERFTFFKGMSFLYCRLKMLLHFQSRNFYQTAPSEENLSNKTQIPQRHERLFCICSAGNTLPCLCSRCASAKNQVR